GLGSRIGTKLELNLVETEQLTNNTTLFAPIFQSERESGDRNFAIGYYLKEKKCFPEGTDMTSILDLYFQVSICIWQQLLQTH
ncbi:hypothetical protein J4Q44_G00045250, partial [Coregonus suidteri]